jgi:hypothetical protein
MARSEIGTSRQERNAASASPIAVATAALEYGSKRARTASVDGSTDSIVVTASA